MKQTLKPPKRRILKQSLKEVLKEKCFNCHDKKEVLVENKETHHKLVKIPCPVCTGDKDEISKI